MSLTRRIEGLLNGFLKAVCVGLFGLMVSLVVWQVFSRFILSSPSAWAEEAAIYTFVWVSMLGVAIAVGERTDIVMDFLVVKLPHRARLVAGLTAHALTLGFVGYVMVYGGSRQAALAWDQLNPVLPLTQGQLYLAVPVGGVLMGLFVLVHLVRTLTADETGRLQHADPEEAMVR